MPFAFNAATASSAPGPQPVLEGEAAQQPPVLGQHDARAILLGRRQRPFRATETIDLVAEPRLEAGARLFADVGQRDGRHLPRSPSAAMACE